MHNVRVPGTGALQALEPPRDVAAAVAPLELLFLIIFAGTETDIFAGECARFEKEILGNPHALSPTSAKCICRVQSNMQAAGTPGAVALRPGGSLQRVLGVSACLEAHVKNP